MQRGLIITIDSQVIYIRTQIDFDDFENYNFKKKHTHTHITYHTSALRINFKMKIHVIL